MRSRNFTVSFVTAAAPATANTEFVVTPYLTTDAGAVVPVGFIVAGRKQAASLYRSTSTWTASAAYLKSDTANASFVVGFFV